jgi:hypothetical protein
MRISKLQVAALGSAPSCAFPPCTHTSEFALSLLHADVLTRIHFLYPDLVSGDTGKWDAPAL